MTGKITLMMSAQVWRLHILKKKKKKACVSDPRCNILGAVRFCTTAVNTPGFNSGQKTA